MFFFLHRKQQLGEIYSLNTYYFSFSLFFFHIRLCVCVFVEFEQVKTEVAAIIATMNAIETLFNQSFHQLVNQMQKFILSMQTFRFQSIQAPHHCLALLHRPPHLVRLFHRTLQHNLKQRKHLSILVLNLQRVLKRVQLADLF